MAGFHEQQYAGRFRDLVVSIARKVVQEERPDLRIGRVYSFDPGTNIAMVLMPGESVNNLLKVRAARNMQPTVTMDQTYDTLGLDAPGDLVRIAGKPGNYFILDYFSGTPQFAMPEWIQVDFENTWGNSSSYASVAFCKFAGIVNVKGVGVGTANTTAFTLPSGYRPAESRQFAGSGVTVDVNPDGTVVPAGTGDIMTTFDQIRFIAEQ